ncbi:MAG: cell division protein FtsA [Patescibacteria group bacterium]
MFELFSNKDSHRSIILDIQSDLIHGVLVENYENGDNKIISTCNKSIEENIAPSNSERIKKKILKLAHDVVSNLIKVSGHKNIFNIHFVLSSPWVFSELKTIKVDFDSDNNISDEIINKIINKEIDKTPSKFNAYVFEKKIYDIKLNGYSVDVYNGREAHKLEISFSVSLAEKGLIDNLKHSINKVIHIKNQSFHSALLTQYLAIPSAISKNTDYIYVHAHGELTDIIVVKNNQCKHISSFPFGSKTLLRKIALSTKHSLESADSLLTMYYDNKLSEIDKKKISSIVDSFTISFSNMCIDSFLSSFDIMHIPKRVYLSAHDHFAFFKSALISQNRIVLEILPYDDFVGKDNGRIINMYTHVLGAML